jgi:hypothetical protein
MRKERRTNELKCYDQVRYEDNDKARYFRLVDSFGWRRMNEADSDGR